MQGAGEILNAQPTRYVLATAGVSGGIALTVLTAPLTGVAEAVSGLLLQSAFLLCGVIAWNLRPQDRTGPLMVACGLLLLFWMGSVYRPAPALAAVAWGLHNLWEGVLIHMVVAFPGGRVRRREERWFLGLTYAFVGVWTPLMVFVGIPDFGDCDRCSGGENPFYVESLGDPISTPLLALNLVGVAGLALWMATILVRRWRRSSPPARRVLSPVLAMVLAAIVVEIGWNVAFALGESTPGSDFGSSSALSDLATLIYGSVFALIPFGLIGGLLRTNVTRSRLGALVTALADQPGPDALRAHLADALGDPSLRVGYHVPDRDEYVDADGRPPGARERPAAGRGACAAAGGAGVAPADRRSR